METISEEIPLLNASVDSSNNLSYTWKVLRGSLKALVHSLIAVNVFVTLCFACNSFPFTPFQLHVSLSVIGYQLLMPHGILTLANYNGWSATLTYAYRRRNHWVLQLAGSILAIAGSVIMMKQKSVNFTSIHGKLALAALIFTCISLLNGVLSLYKVGMLRVLSAKTIKISHLAVGTTAFALSSVCLVYGFFKRSFREWSSAEFSYVMIAITCIYSAIIIYRPCSVVVKKVYRKRKDLLDFEACCV